MRGLLALSAALGVSAGRVTPVEKVTTLLTKLVAQVEEEGKEEAVGYDKFACFCKDQADEKTYRIEKGEEAILKLEAKIENLSGAIRELSEKMQAGRTKIDTLKEKMDEQAAIRKGERKQYESDYTDATDALAACKKAIRAIKASMGEMKDAHMDNVPVLIQAALAMAGSEHQQEVNRAMSALKQDPHAYKFGSKHILDLLTKLVQKFSDREGELYKTESTTKQNFNLAQQERGNEKKFTEEMVAEAEAVHSKKSEEKATADDEKNQIQSDVDSNKAFREDLTAQCEKKAKLFDQRSKARTSELAALAGAIEELKGKGGQNYTANKKLNLLSIRRHMRAKNDDDDEEDSAEEVDMTEGAQQDSDLDTVSMGLMKQNQPPAGEKFERVEGSSESESEGSEDWTSFLQRGQDNGNARVLNYLRRRARDLKSTALTSLAMQLSSGKDVFVKVRNLINDLITRLQEQAESEATQKAFCDDAMDKAMKQRDEAQAKVEKLTAAMEKNEATIADSKQRIKQLQEEVSELLQTKADRTELYQEEKRQNEKAKAEAEEGSGSIATAVRILKKFYEGQGGANAFMQQAPAIVDAENNTVRDLAPDAGFEEEYRGSQEESKGIFGLLEVIKADYDRTVDTLTQEMADNDAEYERVMGEIKADLAAIEDSPDGSLPTTKATLADAESALDENTSKRDTNKKLLKEALTELNENLKPMCVDTAVSHEERLKRREQEIESLKEALSILREMSFLQKRK